VEWGKCRVRRSPPCFWSRVLAYLSVAVCSLSCTLVFVCSIDLMFREGFSCSPSCGCSLCSGLFSHWSYWALWDLAARVSVPPCGDSFESSLHLIVMSTVWRASCGLVVAARGGVGFRRLGAFHWADWGGGGQKMFYLLFCCFVWPWVV